MISTVDVVLAMLGVPALLASAYLALLAGLARASSVDTVSRSGLKFDVVVPAYDEEAGIAETIRSLLAVDYPKELFRVVVVADNCSDRTAERAAVAGALVWPRHDRDRRGKGYALAYAVERSLEQGVADAIVVVDADSAVSENLLSAFARRFEQGAMALQGEYGVRNADASWRTRLMKIAFTAFHGVRSLARERLGLSCGLRGNGMAFSAALLRMHPYRAFSIVEDVEYGLDLAVAGIRVEYVPEALVWGTMVASERASRSQRERWEGGRRLLIARYVPHLLREAWRRRDVVLVDLAVDLLVPPLAQLTAVCLSGTLTCVLLALTSAPVYLASAVFGGTSVGLVAYVGRAWALSGAGWRGLLDLAHAPFYLIWKLTLPFRQGSRSVATEWIRTSREGER